jgi:hypothetical protein
MPQIREHLKPSDVVERWPTRSVGVQKWPAPAARADAHSRAGDALRDAMFAGAADGGSLCRRMVSPACLRAASARDQRVRLAGAPAPRHATDERSARCRPRRRDRAFLTPNPDGSDEQRGRDHRRHRDRTCMPAKARGSRSYATLIFASQMTTLIFASHIPQTVTLSRPGVDDHYNGQPASPPRRSRF